MINWTDNYSAPVALNWHVMLDLETWGVESNALIISIGAAKFFPYDDTIVDTFHVAIEPKISAFGNGVSASTLLWWMHKDRRDALDRWLSMDKVELVDALDGFSKWFGETSVPVWGNGSSFDNVILRNAYKSQGLDAPWSFCHDRDLRTLLSFVEEEPGGGAHDALDDAINQVKRAQRAYHRLGRGADE